MKITKRKLDYTLSEKELFAFELVRDLIQEFYVASEDDNDYESIVEKTTMQDLEDCIDTLVCIIEGRKS